MDTPGGAPLTTSLLSLSQPEPPAVPKLSCAPCHPSHPGAVYPRGLTRGPPPHPVPPPLPGTVWKVDSPDMLRSGVLFLSFNYFGHTACALTHITSKALMSSGSETFSHSLAPEIRQAKSGFQKALFPCTLRANQCVVSVSGDGFANSCGSVQFWVHGSGQATTLKAFL